MPAKLVVWVAVPDFHSLSFFGGRWEGGRVRLGCLGPSLPSQSPHSQVLAPTPFAPHPDFIPRKRGRAETGNLTGNSAGYPSCPEYRIVHGAGRSPSSCRGVIAYLVFVVGQLPSCFQFWCIRVDLLMGGVEAMVKSCALRPSRGSVSRVSHLVQDRARGAPPTKLRVQMSQLDLSATHPKHK